MSLLEKLLPLLPTATTTTSVFLTTQYLGFSPLTSVFATFGMGFTTFFGHQAYLFLENINTKTNEMIALQNAVDRDVIAVQKNVNDLLDDLKYRMDLPTRMAAAVNQNPNPAQRSLPMQVQSILQTIPSQPQAGYFPQRTAPQISASELAQRIPASVLQQAATLAQRMPSSSQQAASPSRVAPNSRPQVFALRPGPDGSYRIPMYPAGTVATPADMAAVLSEGAAVAATLRSAEASTNASAANLQNQAQSTNMPSSTTRRSQRIDVAKKSRSPKS